MKKILLALLLLTAPAWAQYAHRSNPGDPKTTGAAVTSAGASNCPGTGCVVVSTAGATTLFVTISGTWSQTLQFSCSNDNWSTVKVMSAFSYANGAVGGTGTTTTAINGDFIFPTMGLSSCGLYATAFTSNTSQAIRLDADPGQWFNAATLRSSIVLAADGVTPAISDTVITFQKNVAGAVTTAQTSYTVTSGKTLRIQSILCSFTAGATANIVRVRLRENTGGACVVGSGLLIPVCELAPAYGTATASEGEVSCALTIADGLEIVGDGSKSICFSESAVAATGTLTCNLTAYEY